MEGGTSIQLNLFWSTYEVYVVDKTDVKSSIKTIYIHNVSSLISKIYEPEDELIFNSHISTCFHFGLELQLKFRRRLVSQIQRQFRRETNACSIYLQKLKVLVKQNNNKSLHLTSDLHTDIT